jgi:hypothetical protein
MEVKAIYGITGEHYAIDDDVLRPSICIRQSK